MIITVFEDSNYSSLFPLNINRASCELRCGAFTNLERINNLLSTEDSIQLVVRDELTTLMKERYPNLTVNPEMVSQGIWLNGRGLWNENKLIEITSSRSYTNNGILMAIQNHEDIPLTEFHQYLDSASLVSTEIVIQFIKNVWDGIFLQSEVIAADAQNFIDYKQGDIHPTVAIENGDNVFIDGGASVRAGSVLDASAGPIIIADNAYIDIGSLIQGPVYIGPGCVINPGTKLRGNVTLGPQCKIGGEVEDVIFQGFSNKQHDGFLGHSYIGEWVNLGANTNNSDLKNNYGLIQLTMDDKKIETGQQFLGTLMGDYSRTGISTMLNTGTIIGLGANIFGEGFQDKYIPSFRWGKNDTTELEKFFGTIEKMKQRRGKSLSPNEKIYLTKLYEKQF